MYRYVPLCSYTTVRTPLIHKDPTRPLPHLSTRPPLSASHLQFVSPAYAPHHLLNFSFLYIKVLRPIYSYISPPAITIFPLVADVGVAVIIVILLSLLPTRPVSSWRPTQLQPSATIPACLDCIQSLPASIISIYLTLFCDP